MVSDAVSIPQNWLEFLRNDSNKTELFEFLARNIANIKTKKQLITTFKDSVLSTNVTDTSSIAPCDHEEADTRLLIHVADAVNGGHESIMVRTVDADVVVLAISVIPSLNINELWVAFGSGRHLRYIPTHLIALSLGPEKSKSLPLFHAYTGCDTVSYFANRGKKTAWDVWKTYDSVTEAFQSVMLHPDSMTEDAVSAIERYTGLLYNRTSNQTSLDAARMELFFKKGHGMDEIPPTKDAVHLHL